MHVDYYLDNNRRFGGQHGFGGRGHGSGSSSEEHNSVAKTKTTRKPTTNNDPCIGVASGTIVGPCNSDGTCLGTATCLPSPYDFTQQACSCP